MPIHNEAKKGEIAKTVLMPGDPLRAKMVAENYLEDYRLVNQVRNMYAYTGKYKGKEITVMASGMGMASIGIYANELYDYYDVENIIRIGTCGVFDESVGLLDVLLVDGAYNEGNFAYNYDDDDIHWAEATKEINDIASNVANELNIKCIRSNIASTECFDPYQPHHAIGYLSRLPKDKNIVGTEMEAFALYYLAKKLNKKASCLLSVVDTNYPGKDNSKIVTVEQRQNALNDMIKIGLETAIRL
jgi:purine-nucleoside phosphorylase